MQKCNAHFFLLSVLVRLLIFVFKRWTTSIPGVARWRFMNLLHLQIFSQPIIRLSGKNPLLALTIMPKFAIMMKLNSCLLVQNRNYAVYFCQNGQAL